MEYQKRGTIALVTLDYPPAWGGVARYLGNLVQASQGEVDVFVDRGASNEGPGKVERVRLLASTGWYRWWPTVQVMSSLKKRGYRNVIVSHLLPIGTAAWISSWFTGLKYTIIVHGLDLQLVRSSFVRRWIAKKILERASCVIANSKSVSRLARQLSVRARIEVVTPGVESISFVSRQEARRELGLRDDAPIVLAVARLVPRKGIDTLIQVMQSFPNAELVVVGDGEDFARLQRLVSSLSIRVCFIRKSTDAERNQWYAAADCFALPVRQEGLDIEGFGIVYLEAALAGLPVIAGRSGGAPEAVVDGVTGCVVDPTVDGVRDALQLLLSNEALRHQYGEEGRVRALKDFSWSDRWMRISSLLN